ncbi:N-acetylmuramoyl-L-alanine amidase [Acetobacterium wieringae]|uniref:N-acetylmuramoyl-L-alanine amidase n=1 Tax=Acetobacterium wieringae TaxID=52694 RepID=UPI00396AA579
MAVRPVIANNAGADLFISIHHNRSKDPNASGICANCYSASENGIRFDILFLKGFITGWDCSSRV